MERKREGGQKFSESRFILLGSVELTGRAILGSLVTDLLLILKKHGISNDFVSAISLTPSTIRGFPDILRKKKIIEQTVKAPVYLLPRIPPITTWFRNASILLQEVALLAVLLKDILSGKRVVILARSHEAAEIATRLKKIYKKIIVIAILEGEMAAEYEYSQQRKGININSNKIRRYVAYLDRKEKEIILGSDRVCCVSYAFKKHLIQKHHLDTTHIDVLPNGADSSIFYFDENLRNKTKEQLGLQGKFVLVYSGAMYAWQMFPTMLNVFRTIQKLEKEAHFLVLTPFKDKAMEYIKEAGLSKDDYTLLSVEHNLVPAYLTAADLGFLLRENHLLNNVASPVKFSEYVLCGLPVMMTEGIGDYSDFMKAHNFGIIIHDCNDREEIKEKFTRFKEESIDSADRHRFSKYTEEMFSRESQIHKLLAVYSMAVSDIDRID